MSTLSDSLSPLDFADLSPSCSTSFQTSGLSSEVTTLSNKLIRAINHQTDLDDNLVKARQELDEAHRRVKQLEAAAEEHDAMLASGELIHRSQAERQKVHLINNLAYEQKQRGVMEKDKRGMEQELEALTTALFEEANQVPHILAPLPSISLLTVNRWLLQHVRNVRPLIGEAINYELSSVRQSSS